MRGLMTFFLERELGADNVSTALVVCTSDAFHCPQILSHVQQRFAQARFTYVVPHDYKRFLADGADIRLISELRKATLRTWWEIRAQKYDVTVLMLTGQPIFRKTKLWALFTNYRMLLVYNENMDSSTWCRTNWRVVLGHIRWRLTKKGFPAFTACVLTVFLFPLGIVYLLVYTSWAIYRSRTRMFASNTAKENHHHDL